MKDQPTNDTLASLQKQADDVIEVINSIKEQVGRARSAVHTSGDYSDADWYHSANRALKHHQVEHQKLQRLIADVRKTQKEARVKLSNDRAVFYDRAFISISKKLLDEETYSLISRKASEIADSQSGCLA